MPRRLQIAALCACLLVSAGCIFSPSKCGPSGVVLPGSSQYDSYLENCRGRYSELAECCEKWGQPDAIQIGNSGGNFVWRGQPQWLRVGSFSARLVTGRYPPYLRFVEDGGEPAKPAKAAPVAAPTSQYSIERFERTAEDEFAYSFRLRLRDGADAGLGAVSRIKQELRQAVVSEYTSTYGGNAGDVRVDFPEFAMKDAVVEGRAEVMRISVKSLRYDAQAQKGVIAVKIGANRFEDARKWVRKNIETLARDKNVALTTGQIPPAARFFLGAERVLEGNVLEIEFETE